MIYFEATNFAKSLIFRSDHFDGTIYELTHFSKSSTFGRPVSKCHFLEVIDFEVSADSFWSLVMTHNRENLFFGNIFGLN